MNGAKFVSLMNTFGKKEIKGFSNYLQGFYPKMTKAILLYDYLLELYPDFIEEKLEYEAISNYCVSQKIEPFSNKKNYLNTFSTLYGFAQEYFIWKRKINNDFQKDLLWLDELNDRNLHYDFELKAGKMVKGLKKQPISESWDFYNRMLLYYKVWVHQMTNKNKEAPEAIKEMSANLKLFYLHTELMFKTEILNWESIFNGPGDSLNLDKWIRRVASSSKEVFTEALCMVSKLVGHPSEKNYCELKKMYLMESSGLSPTSLATLLTYLINYTAVKIRGGDVIFYKEAFDLYSAAEKRNLFAVPHYLSDHVFQNVINTALQQKKYEWAECFINMNGQSVL